MWSRLSRQSSVQFHFFMPVITMKSMTFLGLLLILAFASADDSKKPRLIPVPKIEQGAEFKIPSRQKPLNAFNQMSIMKRKIAATQKMLEKLNEFDDKLQRGRAKLVSKGVKFFMEALVKTGAVQIDSEGKVVDYDKVKVVKVGKALKQRAARMSSPFPSAPEVEDATCTSMNLAMMLGRLAQVVVKMNKQRFKRMVIFDPDNPDATYPPDYLEPDCKEEPEGTLLTCPEMAYITEVMEMSFEAEKNSGCGPETETTTGYPTLYPLLGNHGPAILPPGGYGYKNG